MAMTNQSVTDPSERAVLTAALATVAVECVQFDGAGRPLRRRLMPLAGLLAPLDGMVSPVRREALLGAAADGLRDAS